MSMRPHGLASIDARAPRALGVCDRCGFLYNHDQLRWQFDYKFGSRLFNLRLLVCRTCYDIPQESGRTIVLPPDPIPIRNARPEDYAGADNPASYLGFDPANGFLPTSQRGMNIGNMTGGAGVDAAFNANANKPFWLSANLTVSNSSFQNTVGKNWAADATGMLATLPSTVPAQTHTVSSITLTAPNDRPFLNTATGVTGVHLDGSANGVTWTTIFSGTTAGTVGEVLTASTTSATPFQFHRIVIQGDGLSPVGIAQAVLNISDAGANEI